MHLQVQHKEKLQEATFSRKMTALQDRDDINMQFHYSDLFPLT